jgi:hypothetical protein
MSLHSLGVFKVEWEWKGVVCGQWSRDGRQMSNIARVGSLRRTEACAHGEPGIGYRGEAVACEHLRQRPASGSRRSKPNWKS